jgi:pyruvate kinase
MRFTKIIATIGPACDSSASIKQLYEDGIDVARLNFSHGDYAYFAEIIKRIRKVSDKIPVMLDTKGPEIRTGKIKKDINLKKGSVVALTNKDTGESSRIINLNHDISKYLKSKDAILIDDGKVELIVIKSSESGLICRVVDDCVLGSNKSVDFPGKDIPLPDITKKDIEDIRFGIKHDIDIIACSLIKKASTIKKIKDLVKGTEIKVFAKIEHPDAVENIGSIIEESEGIMVARGDLGLNMPPEDVPIVQKDIILRCNEAAKPVIVATQMLESMMNNPLPTRAETSDVANAIYDGADCVMLSGETAVGKYPFAAVRMMSRICTKVDTAFSPKHEKVSKAGVIPESIGDSVFDIVNDIDADAIISHTASGFTPSLISRYKPKVPIITITADDKIYRQLSVIRGVFQVKEKDLDENAYFRKGIRKAVNEKLLKKEGTIVLTYNTSKKVRMTNCIEIREIKEFL